MKTHIIFVGFMGTGKTTIGEKLAKKLKLKHVDTDILIETEINNSIQNFFQQYGEEAFRQKETDVLKQILQLPTPTVITTGGGIVLRSENREMMQNVGWIINLDAPPPEIIRRLKTDATRPLLQGGELEERVRTLYQERKPFYRFADITVNTNSFSVKQVVNQLAETWFNLI
jgi:shikimate kinase